MNAILEDRSGLQDCNSGKIAEDIFEVIRPYYKSLRLGSERPEFRKCLKSSEVEDILSNLHDLVVKLKTQ